MWKDTVGEQGCEYEESNSEGIGEWEEGEGNKRFWYSATWSEHWSIEVYLTLGEIGISCSKTGQKLEQAWREAAPTV